MPTCEIASRRRSATVRDDRVERRRAVRRPRADRRARAIRVRLDRAPRASSRSLTCSAPGRRLLRGPDRARRCARSRASPRSRRLALLCDLRVRAARRRRSSDRSRRARPGRARVPAAAGESRCSWRCGAALGLSAADSPESRVRRAELLALALARDGRACRRRAAGRRRPTAATEARVRRSARPTLADQLADEADVDRRGARDDRRQARRRRRRAHAPRPRRVSRAARDPLAPDATADERMAAARRRAAARLLLGARCVGARAARRRSVALVAARRAAPPMPRPGCSAITLPDRSRVARARHDRAPLRHARARALEGDAVAPRHRLEVDDHAAGRRARRRHRPLRRPDPRPRPRRHHRSRRLLHGDREARRDRGARRHARAPRRSPRPRRAPPRLLRGPRHGSARRSPDRSRAVFAKPAAKR